MFPQQICSLLSARKDSGKVVQKRGLPICFWPSRQVPTPVLFTLRSVIRTAKLSIKLRPGPNRSMNFAEIKNAECPLQDYQTL